MKFLGLGVAAALGVMLSLPVLAQTTTTQPPAAKPPMAVTTPPPMTTTMPPAAATRPTTTPAAAATTTTTTPPHGKTAKAPAAPMAPVDINSATAVELDKVKFIGPARARKIIAGRPWANTDDLVTKKVLPRAQYDQVKANLMVR